jgi:hypothetical protein
MARIPWEEIEARIDKETEKNERASVSRIVNELRQDAAIKRVTLCHPLLMVLFPKKSHG